MISSRIIIIGSGPAGMACAIQLKRMGLVPLVIEKDKPGGMIANANMIENYPGFPGGIAGEKLAELVVEQYLSFDIETIKDEITEINFHQNRFHLKGKIMDYLSDIIVVATGTKPGIPGEITPVLINSGLIHFDISLIKKVTGKVIGIIGAGDAAFDYGLTMAGHNKVLIFNRNSKIKALKALQDKVFINNTIQYFENYTLTDILITDNKQLTALFNSASSNSKYSLDYLIFATGRIPENEFFSENLKGNLPNLLKEKRLCLAGDIANENYRQVSIAIAQGIRTAMEIFRNENNQ